MKRKGFTLIEMLVVIGIIGILMATALAAFSHMTANAEHARCQELVSNACSALTAYYNDTGYWPKVFLEGCADGEGRLDEKVTYPLAKKGYLTLTYDDGKKRLSGNDFLGMLSPWALTQVKRSGAGVALSTRVTGGTGRIEDHILRYSIDDDGDGYTSAVVGGERLVIRATAAVWCCGKDGKIEAYRKGLKRDDVYSWTRPQVKE